jgi:two-component system sensor histidine kinase CiaH
MFRLARLKLTAWYLLIIMLICILFSLVIYRGVTFELERRFGEIERQLQMGGIRGFPHMLQPGPPLFQEDLAIAKGRVLLMLIYANGVILVLSGIAGYFLAGKTLQPIEHALEEQKRFVADASHELRTPLTALKASTEVALRDKKLSKKEAKQALESNLEDIDSLQILADNLLSLAQYEKGNHDFVFEQVNLGEVIANGYKKLEPLASKKDISVKINASKIILEANRESLEKMMLIFLDNAVKYTPDKGKVSVILRHDNRHAFIEFRDSGIGIDQKDINQIFNRFYRVDQSRSKTKVAGFGLGLSMAKKIVDLHNGNIEVSSTAGQGTVFTVKLPLSHA